MLSQRARFGKRWLTPLRRPRDCELAGPGEAGFARGARLDASAIGSQVERRTKQNRNRTMSSLKAAVIPVTPFQQNCTLLWDEASGRGAVVDPGGEVARILQAIDQQGVRVEKILLTHGHIDHAGGAAELKERLEQRQREAGEPAGIPIEGRISAICFCCRGSPGRARASA